MKRLNSPATSIISTQKEMAEGQISAIQSPFGAPVPQSVGSSLQAIMDGLQHHDADNAVGRKIRLAEAWCVIAEDICHWRPGRSP